MSRQGHRHLDGWIALGLGALSLLVLVLNAPRVGYTRDESFYFDAAESYAGWFRELARNPGRALDEPVIRRYYEINREHPVLVKNLMALSFLALATDTPAVSAWPPPRIGAYARAMRLPSQAFAALAVSLTYLLGVAVWGRRAGLLAALAFLLAPRHFYHAQLACFDMPAVAVWLATVLAYRRAQSSAGWGMACGVIWGLALAVKHNSFFLAPVLLLHWMVQQRREFSLSRSGLRLPRIPLAFFSMLLLGPAIFIGHWPFLWHQTLERLGWYFGFHLHHVHYWWEYCGTLLTEPPFPVAYPFVVTALTLPLPTLLLGGWGIGAALGERLGHPLRALAGGLARLSGLRTPGESGASPAPRTLERGDAWLLLLNAAIPFLIIAWPDVPIFGGVKHWMHAMPFVCVLGAVALERMLAALPERLGRWRLPRNWSYAALSALVLLPSVQGLVHIGPYGTSYYNELAGGVRGAADLGMQRQYWSNNVSGVLPWLNANLPEKATVYFHEVTLEAFRAYKRDGLLRPDIRPGWHPDTSDFVVYQYHREFVDTEYRVWNKTGHHTILYGLYLDQVPQILVYDARLRAAPRPRGGPATGEPGS